LTLVIELLFYFSNFFSQSEETQSMTLKVQRPTPGPRAKAASRAASARTNASRVDAKSSVQSLAKGFRVLEAFSTVEEMTLTEIGETAGLDAGTTFRMVNTLVDLGYLARIADSRRFRLTLKVLDLGFHAIARQDLRALVRPVLQSLVGEVSEAASFGVIEGADVLYIERVRAGFTRLGVDIRIGTTIPAAASSIGHAILAFLPEATVAGVLASQPRDANLAALIPSRPALLRALTETRERGYVLQDSMISGGLRILAAPVLNGEGEAVGGISVAAPSIRISEQDLKQRALEPVRNAARDIARALEAAGGTAMTH
jgi:IclR family pca regulon transcriptional regulator